MTDENKQCCCSRGRDGECGTQNKSCGHNGSCDGGCQNRIIYITEDEKTFLMKLAQIPFLPLTRFVMRSTASDDTESGALAPVYMEDKNDAMNTVKKTGDILLSLEEKYLITLDYDLPLQNGDYSVYEESELYQLFRSTVAEGGKQAGFLFDQPVLERGSIALTALGQDALDSLE